MKTLWHGYRLLRSFGNRGGELMWKAVCFAMGRRVYLDPRSGR